MRTQHATLDVDTKRSEEDRGRSPEHKQGPKEHIDAIIFLGTTAIVTAGGRYISRSYRSAPPVTGTRIGG